MRRWAIATTLVLVGSSCGNHGAPAEVSTTGEATDAVGEGGTDGGATEGTTESAGTDTSGTDGGGTEPTATDTFGTDSEGSSACDDLEGDGPAVTVRTVDEHGAPVDAISVRWLDPLEVGVWRGDPEFSEPATWASCLDGGEAPCSEWMIERHFTDRILVAAEAIADEAGVDAWCLPYRSQCAVLHPAAQERQRLTLVLPSNGNACGTEVDHLVPTPDKGWHHEVGAADCLLPPQEVSGSLRVHTVRTDDAPLPVSTVVWYHPPNGPSYDGDHPLACADAACTAWIATDAPETGQIFIAAKYLGPMHPLVATNWEGYNATSIQRDAEATADAPQVVTLAVEILQAAF